MHKLSNEEKDKRGCLYCMDRENAKTINKSALSDEDEKGSLCPYNRCPYRELDKYKRYKDYDKEKAEAFGSADVFRF